MGLCGQYFRLLVIFIKLKSWKLLFSAVVFAALVSNHYLYKSVDSWMLRTGEKNLQIIGAKEFQEDCVVLADPDKYSTEMSVMANSVNRMSQSGTDFNKHNLERCKTGDNCPNKYFRMLLGQRQGKLAHYIDFESAKDGRAKLHCQMSSGTELYCPFMAYLVGISQPQDPDPAFQYNSSHVFRLLSTATRFPNAPGPKKSLCKSDVSFPTTFPRTLMTQMIFVTITLVFYLLVCTVSCVHELRHNGFLQLIYRKGLSGLAYWFALWTITLLEMAIFAAVLTVSYHFQCAGFYPSARLVQVFLCCFLQFCHLAAIVLLFTVITPSIAITSLLACLYHLVAVTFIVASGTFLSGSQGLKYVMLVMPLGHIAGQVRAALLKGLIPDDKFAGMLLPVTGVLLVLLIIATLYLEFVLKSGNGLNLPHGYLFLGRFWSQSNFNRVDLEEPSASVMVEEVSDKVKPVIYACRLNKVYRTCMKTTEKALTNFSAKFYQDQITAIVGHNGSGKSTLLQILSGDRHPTKGKATMNKWLLTDPLSRYHLGNEIGYCPQPDALVDRLTVLDTLKLTTSSSGLAWADVQMDVQTVLSTLQIEEKINHSIYNLSSSDKRKVCVTMALIGKPRVILLDNPCRDMDYISKRRMWNLLHEYKKGRVIIFSTLFIDEAEGMADRLIFLSGGKVVCAGSSLFFKRVFDCQYIIQIASKTEFHVPYIIRKVTSKFSTVRVRTISYSDLEFEVGLIHDEILSEVISDVESLSGLIAEFGIAQFCLDDVFSRLKGLTTDEIKQHLNLSTIGFTADDNDRIMALKNRPEPVLPSGPREVRISSSAPSTAMAMMRAQFQQMPRSRGRLLARVFVPVLLLLLVAGASVLERLAKNAKVAIRYNLSDTTEFERDKGVCMHYFSIAVMFDPSNHMESIGRGDCSMYLSGTNKSNDKVHGLEMEISDQKSFIQAIRKYLPDIRKKCGKTLVPCPVAFSSDWCPHRSVSKNHEVYVGSYISNDDYTAQSVAMTSVEMFKNMVAYLTLKLTKGNFSITPNFDTEGIMGITGVFYHFYGLFVQMVLLSVIPAICLMDIIQDRRSGIRSQLLSMGMSRIHYWLCTLVAHWIQLAIVYLLSAALLIVIVSSGYASTFYFVIVLPLTLTFSILNNLLCVYALGVLIENTSHVQVCIAAYVFFGLIVSASALLAQTSCRISQIMIFALPQYAAIAPTFYGVKLAYYANAFYSDTGSEDVPSLLQLVFAPGHIRDSLIALVIHFCALIALLALLDNKQRVARAFRAFCQRGKKYKAEPALYNDCGELSIVEEINLLEKSPKREDHIMEAEHLKVATFGGRLKMKNLTLGLKHGQVLGLIGPCGSGKGSAVRAIVGVQHQTAGRVDFHVKDRWLCSGSAAQQGFIGYCPKYDPVMQRLTIRENLQFYARAIGIPLERVQQLVKQFRLESEANRLAMHVTAGVRRSLTLAISTLASPRFVAIDQLSAGVDPEGREILWQSVKSLAGKQRSVLVATQSMEEAEKLCDRICIMNCGSMAALTSIEEIIHRYKRMYFLEIQVCDAETPNAAQLRKDEIKSVILGRFAGSIVIEQLTLRIQFGIPIESVGRLSTTLSWLVIQKKRLNILYFSIHYATIDQTMKAIVVHQESQMLECQEDDASVAV